ncbi:Thioesterase PikA5 [Streptomyces sp. enrichment culture]|uniref:thioesterase II family protein n=1 Tax=Streptomyces xiamenensis TaxID=408015 RepID=UPI0036F0DCF2
MSRPPTAGALDAPRWFLRSAPRAGAELVLYCVPHAGAGASFYRSWSALLPPWIDVAAVRLPGRERRIAEPPAVDPGQLAAAITADAAGRPYALFGHSMGGLLSFEVARLLAAAHPPGPVRLAVSATAPPRTPVPSTISDLPQESLLAWLREQGTPHQLLEDPQLLELLIPPLRADSAWMENYRYRPGPSLPCPISVFAGEADPRTRACELSEWSAETLAGCVVRRYPGDHFYLARQPERLLGDLAGDLTPYRGKP